MRHDRVGDSEALAKVLWYYNLIDSQRSGKCKIVCPFHDRDVNPSLLVDLQDGSWFCFGCQVGGGAERFVEMMESKYNNLNSLQSYIKFRKILKSEKCSRIKISSNTEAKHRKLNRQLYDEAYDYYHGLRTVDWRNCVEPEEIDAMGYMRRRGYSSEAMNAVNAKITYSRSYGLIFPMMDNGKFRGWVSRTMRKDIEAKRKYLYNKGFSRATTLVGNYGKQEYVIVVEGYMDRLRFIECGIHDSVVAILGWKMSRQQEDKLRSAGITKVISCLDNDECGRKGIVYLKSVFGPHNVTRWKYLRGVKDPGDMTRDQFYKMYNSTMREYNRVEREI